MWIANQVLCFLILCFFKWSRLVAWYEQTSQLYLTPRWTDLTCFPRLLLSLEEKLQYLHWWTIPSCLDLLWMARLPLKLEIKLHSSHLNSTFSWTDSICFVRCIFCLNSFLQVSHWNFIPSWNPCWWSRRWLCLEKDLPQMLQKCFIFKWTATWVLICFFDPLNSHCLHSILDFSWRSSMWLLKLCFLLDLKSHRSHSYKSCSLEWLDFLWELKTDAVENFLPQSSHLYLSSFGRCVDWWYRREL